MSAIHANRQESIDGKYKKIFEESIDAIFLADVETGIILDCNLAATELVGRAKGELIGQHQSILHPLQEMENGFTKSYKDHIYQLSKLRKEGVRIDTQVITKSGEIKDVSIRGSLMNVDGKKVICGSFRDVTEQKKAQEALRNSEEQFRSLAENSPNMIFINQNRRIVYVNQECERVMGYSKEEFYSPDFSFLKLFLSGSENIIEEKMKRHMIGQDLSPYEFRLVTKNGGIVEAILNLRPVTFNGEPALLGIATDITECTKAEREISMQKEKLAAVFASSPDAIIILNKDGVIVDCNGKTEAMFRRPKEDMIGTNAFAVMDEENAKVAFAGLAEILSTGEPNMREFACIRGDGEKFPVEGTASLLKDKYGEVSGFVVAFRDVTERKKAEQVILEQKEKLAAIFSASPDGLLVIDREGRIADCNEKAEQLFLRKKKELIGSNQEDAMSKADAKRAMESLQEAALTGKTSIGEYTCIRSNGEQFPAEGAANVLRDQNGNIVGAIVAFRDITDRKKAEEQIRLLSNVAQQSVEGIAVSDKGGKILFLNSAWIKMYKAEKIEKSLIGKSIERFYDLDQLGYVNRNMSDEAIFRGRLKQIAEDGTSFTTMATFSPLRDKEGNIIGTIHTAKKLTDLVREIREVGSHTSKTIQNDGVA